MDAQAKERLATLVGNLRGDRSFRDFARYLGVSLRAVQNWEEGKVMASPKNLQKIAAAASMDIKDLYTYLDGQLVEYDPKTPQELYELAKQRLDDDGIRELIKLLVDAIGR